MLYSIYKDENRRNLMKKIIAGLLSLVMLLSLFSCNAENLNDDENINDESTNDINSNTDPDQQPQIDTITKAFKAVLNNEMQIYDTDTKEYCYLSDYKTPSENILLRYREDLRYAYTDIDEDLTEELVIDCGDTLILRYYDSEVYLYSLTSPKPYILYVDGSYYWSSKESSECGYDKIFFEGAEIRTKSLYRIVNEGEENAEYYIGDEQVSQEDFFKNVNDGPELWLQFEALDVPWQKKLTEEEALQIASEYWGVEDGFVDYGAGSMWIHRIMILGSHWGYYHIGLQIDHYGRDENDLREFINSYTEFLFVNSVTGAYTDIAPIYNDTPNTDKNEQEQPPQDEQPTNQHALAAYNAAIMNSIPVYYPLVNSDTPHKTYFKNIHSHEKGYPSYQVLVDMDGDGIDELVLRYYSFLIILHFEDGKVYATDFTFDAMNTIYTDGSFSWSHTDVIFGYECGISRISFTNGILKIDELCRRDSYSNFFVGGLEVDEEQYDEYFEGLEKTPVTFVHFGGTDADSSDDHNKWLAIELASEHWGIKDGDFDEERGFRYRIICDSKISENLYEVSLYCFEHNSYYIHVASARVNIETGNITITPYPDGKG